MTGPAGPGLWADGSRAGPDPALDRLNRSLPFDWRLWPYELAVDRAWVAELAALGLVDAEEARRLDAGLEAVRARLAAWHPGDEPDEDIHSLIERWLEEEVGPLASRVRLGRSRNDVVATDARMWARDACAAMDARLERLATALVDAAARAGDAPFPVYSHLQRAQPTRAAAWLLSHVWPLLRNRDRLADAARRFDRLPLGTAAGSGSALGVDRDRLARALGFDAPDPSALDAVGARDWAAEVVWCWTMTAVDLTRLAEDLVLFASSEFGIVRLGDAWTTGSSLMPQKRNPDGAELARAGGGALIGLLTGLLATLKGLPSGYAKDLQEDKRALFEAEARLAPVLDVLAGTVRGLEIVPAAAARALDPGVFASDLAEALAVRGLPFREAHLVTARLVRRAAELGVPLPDLLAGEAAREAAAAGAGEHGAWDDGAWEKLRDEVFDVEAALERRRAAGGSARAAIAAQLRAAREALGGSAAPPRQAEET
ncbi:MAG: argininosuccinate lyase [Gemmatimonadota bacterium]|nr:argininosuccinate lyase [Gemmatimonadota bacterium]